MKRFLLAAFAAIIFVAGPAYAVAVQINYPTVLIAASASSVRVALPANSSAEFMITSDVDDTCFVKTGSSTVTAAATDTPVLGGSIQTFTKKPDHTYVAAICPAGSGTIYFTVGNGD